MGELATMDEGVKFVLGDGGSTVEVLITVIVVIRLDTVDCPMLMGELKVMDEDASSALEDWDIASDVNTLATVDCPMLTGELAVMDEDANSVLDEVLVGLITTDVDNLGITKVVGMLMEEVILSCVLLIVVESAANNYKKLLNIML